MNHYKGLPDPSMLGLDDCNTLDEALGFCLARVTNIRLRAISIRAAQGIKEDPVVSSSEARDLFISTTARWVLKLETDSHLMNNSDLEEFNDILAKSLESQRKRYVLIGKLHDAIMTVNGSLLPC